MQALVRTYTPLIPLLFLAIFLQSCQEDPNTSEVLLAAAAEQLITPSMGEVYEDLNGNNRWEEDEPYEDTNGNNQYDPLWIANDVLRPALRIQDDLYVTAVVFEKAGIRIGMIALDSFGHGFPELERIRQDPAFQSLGIDLLVMGSSHTHEGPDTVGLYGPSLFESGVDPDYMAYVRQQAIRALGEAVENLVPATMESAMIHTGLDTYQIDQRDPVILDDLLSGFRFRASSDGSLIATMINWASHPEQVINGSAISSDFVGAFREAQKQAHPGSIAVFFQGALGGQIGSNNITFSHEGRTYGRCGDCSFEKASALGEILSNLTEMAFAEGHVNTDTIVRFQQQPLLLPLENIGFQVVFNAGTIDRHVYNAAGEIHDGEIVSGETEVYLKSEMVYVQLGDVAMLSVPGELHPELAIGGYDGSSTPGGTDALWSADNTGVEDLSLAPAPPYLRDLLDARVTMILGLTQDFVGYIIPVFNFDVHPESPYLDSHDWDHHYEETNSLGPGITSVVQEAALKLVGEQ